MSTTNNPHWGSTLEDFLKEEGILELAKAEAVTRVVAWQLSEEMKRQGISKARLAELMNTSRAQLDRILKAKSNVTIETLQRAAALVGRQLKLEASPSTIPMTPTENSRRSSGCHPTAPENALDRNHARSSTSRPPAVANKSGSPLKNSPQSRKRPVL